MALQHEELMASLQTWMSHNGAVGVEFQHVSADPQEDSRDYRVLYEYRFRPDSMEKASIELWLTDDGAVAIGIERRDRIARRCGLMSQSIRFGGGFEPRFLDLSIILRICEAVSSGEVEVSAYGVLGRLSSCHIALRPGGLPQMSPSHAWMNRFTTLGIFQKTTLAYRRWDVAEE